MQIIHNPNYYHPKKEYFVKCAKFHKEAKITVYYHAVQQCRTDNQLTQNEVGRKCTLWEENGYMCLDCPHLPK